MKKNTRYILITLAAAVVLGGAVTALLLTQPATEDASSSSSSTSSTETISLFSYEESEVSNIQVKNANDTFTIVAKTETSSASSEDEEDTTITNFYLDGVDEAIQNTTATSLSTYGYSLTATNEIGNEEDLTLEDYGLKDPQATVTTTLTDGTTETYSIGNEGPISGYYVLYDGKVYVVSLGTGLFGTKLDFINTTVLTITPPSNDDDSSDSSSSEEATNDFTLFTFNGTNFPQEVKVVPQPESLLSSYKLTTPYTVDANSTVFTNITDGVAALTATKAVVIDPTDEDLEEYGLKDPMVEMSFTVNGNSYTLLSGKLSGNTRYGMLKGVDVIYAFDESTVTDWANATLFSLRDTFVSLEMISDVSKLTVATPDKTDVFTLTRTENEESSTEDKISYDYSVTGTDGQEITYQDVFTKYYQTIIGVQLLEETTEETAQGEPVLTITYEYYEGGPARVVKFYSIGDRRCLAEVDGQVVGVVTSQSVQDIIDNTEIILQNKSVEGDTEE